MKNELKVKGLDLLRISPNGDTVHKYDETSKMKGQTYRRFKYNGKVFIVNTNETQFISAQAAGKLNEVNLEINEEGQLGFVDCITAEQFQNFRLAQVEDAKTDGMINYYKTAKFVPSSINALEELPS